MRTDGRKQFDLGRYMQRIGVQRYLGRFAQPCESRGAYRLRHIHPRAHYAIQRTTPATPSTATVDPSGMRWVASSTPSTIGMPRSRAREAICEVLPPRSATTPPTLVRMWLSAGPATLVTRISPGDTRDSSHSQLTTQARPVVQPMPAA